MKFQDHGIDRFLPPYPHRHVERAFAHSLAGLKRLTSLGYQRRALAPTYIDLHLEPMFRWALAVQVASMGNGPQTHWTSMQTAIQKACSTSISQWADRTLIALEIGASKTISQHALENVGYKVHLCTIDRPFLQAGQLSRFACLILSFEICESDPELVTLARCAEPSVVLIKLVNGGNVRDTVKAMRDGCSDVIDNSSRLSSALACISETMQSSRDGGLSASRLEAMRRLALLTPRQAEILERVLQGQPSKVIASDLSISQRTVENHRASIMTKTGSRSLPALARLAITADGHLPAVPTRHAAVRRYLDTPAR